MSRRGLWIAGALTAIALASSTAEGRAKASARIARWNPLWCAIIIGLLALIFWPR